MEDLMIERGNIPKLLNLYKDCEENVEIDLETSGTRESLVNTNTENENVDIISFSDDEKLDSESNISAETVGCQSLRSTSSSSSLVVHVCTYEGCDKFFSRPFRLAQHIRTHTGERPYVCPDESCSRSYARQQHLKRHLETVHQDKETEEKLKCAICDKSFSNVYCLRKHVHRFHEKKRYDCEECGQSFVKQQQLFKHTAIHSGIKPFPCDHPGCEMRFMSLSAMKCHKLTHEKNRYTCPEESCQQKFDTYKELQQHIPAVHPKVCDICGKTFRQLRSLKRHRLTHEPQAEAYFCMYPACNRHYFHLSNLTSHIKNKHQQLNIYSCNACDKRLSTKQKLIQHMATHDPAYRRNYTSKKPRKPRKDKGSIKRNLANLLSGYTDDMEEDDMAQSVQPETTPGQTDDASTSVNDGQNTQSEGSSRDELESDEIS
ncbi:transcription factor IIIA-like isoform X2 [Portunus trituberculatus]|uniref:transcription factor IIIA-like isoform X2 n=1 Tax=Portunus trituberculatus TaxID=210409 RepID=UPI001E1D0E89|nr:transcription factor IIIA-like isoform X2 [Portunus trituberculatus]